jgi:sporulation protein YlmC with PRC-barrel domain
VTVERQGEPQVTVQRQGEPQVTVQQQGEPRVTMQRTDQAQRQQAQAQPGNDQRTGATSATPAPAQSGGSQPQQTAASPAAGVALQSVQNLIGTNVVGANGREAGEVRNLLIDNQGRVRAAVVEWGGFLGIGTREALVPIERIQLGQGGTDRAQLNMTREELEALPRYDRDRATEYGRERGWGEGLRPYR